MAFDTTTRNRLAKFVAEARRVLTEEFYEQLQSLYGISAAGGIAPLERLTHLNAEGLELAATLRQRIAYLTSSSPAAGDATRPAIDRLTREQAFTVLNRLAAIRMAEKRGLIVESVGQQYQSKGFKVFESVAGSAIGDTYDRYRCYLFCLFDELAIDLGSLFDRRSPQALLFPREQPLLALLTLLDDADLQDLWAEDETIGWIYQYYNDPAERKKMREESAAPRDSRELAVRNQFFTPRYVVEFLTDNTLGRIWYEMTQGVTALKEQCRYLVRRPTEIFLKPGENAPEQPTQDGLSQEDLLKQPVFIAHRPLKDPRNILMLDPACGSMHFGLYAFDLFEAIYDEAWEIAAGSDAAAKSGEAFAPFCTFAASFADKAAFQREVPRMIVEHNLHGIDIDPRAAQIAGLSLWLRAQRAWHAASVKPVDRPRITRSNIVCAEPMPGDKVLLAEFVEQQFPEGERAAFGFLLETVFDRMTLAGEAGSLLKIEEEIRTAIAEAKKLWEKEPAFNQRMLFGGENAAEVTQKKLDLSGITNEQFWERAEERIYDALRDYAEQAESGGFQRRLFAEDAARGFAFIDICRKRYDAVVMNPPFGLMRPDIYRYAVSEYPNSYCDFGIAFMDRGLAVARGLGLVGAITSRSFMSVTDAEKFRVNVAIATIQIVVDLGLDVMDGAWVDSCAQVFSGGSTQPFVEFVKSRGELLTPETLLDTERRVLRLRNSFRTIPKARLSYDVEGGLASMLSSGDGLESSGVCLNRTGASTFEDERFRRVWWEVSPLNVGPTKTWCYVAKSCEFNLFYYPYDNLVKWAGNGDELAERNRRVNEQTAQARQGSSFYFRPGLSFSRRGEPTIAFRTYPADCAFSSNGAVVLPTEMKDADYLLGLLNSSWVRAAIHTQAHKFSYSVGHPKAIAWVSPSIEQRTAVAQAAQRIIGQKLSRFRTDERDNYFVAPCGPVPSGLSGVFDQSTVDRGRMHGEMIADMQSIDRVVASVYSLDIDEIDWERYNTSVE
ncbi:MAG: system adenine-specific DNA-methyltransferase PglX, partial [Planctomycetota bacterium]